MTRALVFDQSMASSGWAFGTEHSTPRDDGNPDFAYGVIKTPKRDDVGERLAILWRESFKLIEKYDPEIIGYEEPFFPIQGRGGSKPKQKFVPRAGFLDAEIREEDAGVDEGKGGSRFNPEMLKQLQMVKGIIITQAALRGIPCIGCAASSWRKTVLGFGRKPEGESESFMKSRVKKHFQMLGFDVSGPHDVTDALGILQHTLHGKEAAERKQGSLMDLLKGSL